jgi:glycosyltransferase involved in cell wall biosynthesis
MKVHFWRTRKDLSIAWRTLSTTPFHLVRDMRDLMASLFRKVLGSTDFYKKAKLLASRLGLGLVKSPDDPKIDISRVASFTDKTISKEARPIIFASYCAGINFQGNLKFCGGTKELNYLLKLARQHGYEAYMVTFDGTYEPWLLDHQPHISLDDFMQIIRDGREVRCVTSWAVATAFIQASPQLYFWDMELAATEHEHFPLLANLYRRKICGSASISRTIQSWHMSHFQRKCVLLPNLLDESLWFPQPHLRKPFRIGYMNEGAHTDTYIDLIKNNVAQASLNLEFHPIRGVEKEVLDEMCSCDIYLSMNIGKDALWGEGCPRTVLEALSTGCIVIAFDIIGNRETLQDNFNGFIVPRYRPDLMAEALVKIYSLEGELERLRSNSLNLIQSCHTLEARWSAVKDFLQL